MADADATPLRVGIVGAGRIARDYLSAFTHVDDAELVAITDIDAGARDAMAADTSLPAFASVREMMAETTLDAVIVSTPPASHEPVATELVGHGIHVLCEKPLALTSAGASRMLHAASRAGVLLMMASKFRYVPDIGEAQRIISSGQIGEPILFDVAFCSLVDMTERWNADPPTSGGGALVDNGSHAVDVARFLMGPLVRVMAHFGRRVQPLRVEDSARVMIETAGACLGVVDLSWSVDKASDHYLAVQGTEGTLQVGWQGSRYRRAGGDWVEFGSGYDKVTALAAQLRNFVGAIRGDEQPLVTADDAMASVRAVEAAYRSARVGRWVPLQGYAGAG